MFNDLYKGQALIISPVKADNPYGNYICIRSDLSIFRIHHDEMYKQVYGLGVTFHQTNNYNKFLAFDRFNGDLVAILYHKSKHISRGLVLKSPNGKKAWEFQDFHRSSIDIAPPSFFIKIHRFYSLLS